MQKDILSQILALKSMKRGELLKKYEELFAGEKPVSKNSKYLMRKIAYRLQELEYGDLSEKAKSKITELIGKYNPINNKILRQAKWPKATSRKVTRDTRLPIPGSVITKVYKGTIIKVTVLERGFEYGGKVYRSLSKIANEVSGNHWNGYIFFNL